MFVPLDVRISNARWCSCSKILENLRSYLLDTQKICVRHNTWHLVWKKVFLNYLRAMLTELHSSTAVCFHSFTQQQQHLSQRQKWAVIIIFIEFAPIIMRGQSPTIFGVGVTANDRVWGWSPGHDTNDVIIGGLKLATSALGWGYISDLNRLLDYCNTVGRKKF